MKQAPARRRTGKAALLSGKSDLIHIAESCMPLTNFSAATDKGLLRDNNEDCYLSLPQHGLWLVADGMGGHEAGEVASAIATDSIQRQTEQGKTLVEAIQAAHTRVLEAARNGEGAVGMGSTVVALHSDGQDYEVAWVGDSRAYLWSTEADGHTLQQLTTDHSYVQMLLASGAINEEQLASHPDRNVITQCLGSADMEVLQVDKLQGQWQEGQWILLCSDGLTDELDDAQIAEILSQSRNVREAVRTLMERALRHGGRDNITVQLVESPLGGPPNSRFDRWLGVLHEQRKWLAGIYLAGLLCLALLFYWLWP